MKRVISRRKSMPQCRLALRTLAAPAIFAVALSACTEVGDFDRPTISIRETASILAVSSDTSAYAEQRYSDYSLTYKEERMRSLGYRLIQPLGVEPRYRDVITSLRYTQAGFTERPLSNGDQYYEYLRQNHERYEEALWNKLIGDIQDDADSTLRFTAAALRVVEQDARRLEIFSTRNNTPPDHDDLIARVEENSRFIELVTNALADRISVYRQAVDRAELESPSDLVFTVRSKMDNLAYQYQQLVWMDGDGKGATARQRATNAAYIVVEPPLVDLSGG
jgi:hypothetical protein